MENADDNVFEFFPSLMRYKHFQFAVNLNKKRVTSFPQQSVHVKRGMHDLNERKYFSKCFISH